MNFFKLFKQKEQPTIQLLFLCCITYNLQTISSCCSDKAPMQVIDTSDAKPESNTQIQIQQRLSLKHRELQMKKDILENLTSIIDERFTTKTEELTKEMKKIKAQSLGASFHLQANNNFERKEFKRALWDYVTTANFYIDCDDNINLHIVLTQLIVTLNKVRFIDLNEMYEVKKASLNDLLKRVEASHAGGALDDLVEKIREKVREMKKKHDEETSGIVKKTSDKEE